MTGPGCNTVSKETSHNTDMFAQHLAMVLVVWYEADFKGVASLTVHGIGIEGVT